MTATQAAQIDAGFDAKVLADINGPPVADSQLQSTEQGREDPPDSGPGGAARRTNDLDRWRLVCWASPGSTAGGMISHHPNYQPTRALAIAPEPERPRRRLLVVALAMSGPTA